MLYIEITTHDRKSGITRDAIQKGYEQAIRWIDADSMPDHRQEVYMHAAEQILGVLANLFPSQSHLREKPETLIGDEIYSEARRGKGDGRGLAIEEYVCCLFGELDITPSGIISRCIIIDQLKTKDFVYHNYNRYYPEWLETNKYFRWFFNSVSRIC